MTSAQQRILMFIALAVLAIVTVTLLVVLVSLASGRLTGNTLPGSAYLLVMDSAAEIEKIFGVAITVVTAGINLLGRASTRTWMVYLSSALCLLGLLACFLLFVALRSPDLARPVWNRAAVEMTFETFQAQHSQLIRLLALWLGSFLASQLGVSLLSGSGGAKGATTGAKQPTEGEAPPPPSGSAGPAGGPPAGEGA